MSTFKTGVFRFSGKSHEMKLVLGNVADLSWFS